MYASAKRIWLCIRLNNARKYCNRSTYRRCRVWHKKNHFFRWSSVWTYIEKPKHSKRVTVWCGFWFRGIIGPVFFENEQVKAVTVNGDRYRAMLNEYLFTKIEEEDIGNIRFQQNGTTCHTAEDKLDVLRLVF